MDRQGENISAGKELENNTPSIERAFTKRCEAPKANSPMSPFFKGGFKGEHLFKDKLLSLRRRRLGRFLLFPLEEKLQEGGEEKDRRG